MVKTADFESVNLGSIPSAAAIRERIARAIWAKRPDCQGKQWPIETDLDRRSYPHNPIAACDLCFIYADAAIAEMESSP